MSITYPDPFKKYQGPGYIPFPPMSQSYFSPVTDVLSSGFDKISDIARPAIFLTLLSTSAAITNSLITTTANATYLTLYNRDISEFGENFNQNELIANGYTGLYGAMVGLGISIASSLIQNGKLPSFSKNTVTPIKIGANVGRNIAISSYIFNARNKIISAIMPSSVSGWLLSGIGLYSTYQLGKRILGRS